LRTASGRPGAGRSSPTLTGAQLTGSDVQKPREAQAETRPPGLLPHGFRLLATVSGDEPGTREKREAGIPSGNTPGNRAPPIRLYRATAGSRPDPRPKIFFKTRSGQRTARSTSFSVDSDRESGIKTSRSKMSMIGPIPPVQTDPVAVSRRPLIRPFRHPVPAGVPLRLICNMFASKKAQACSPTQGRHGFPEHGKCSGGFGGIPCRRMGKST
jgi:hypothetical protein